MQPKKAVAVPTTIVRNLVAAMQLPVGPALTTEQAMNMNKATLAGAKAEFIKYADRAELLLVPVYGPSPGHWTLLAAQRTSPSSSPGHSTLLDTSGSAAHGCVNCKGSHCKACDALTSARAICREQEEALILDQHSRPVIVEPGEWQLSYWDGLLLDHQECKQAARQVAQVLLGCEEQPDLQRENRSLQGACDCGFRAIYWAEELCRRRRGEGKWTIPFRLEYVHERVAQMCKKIKGH